MSVLSKPLVVAAAAFCLAAGAAHAAVQCPANVAGHPAARAGGASLYLGDPSAQMDLAPDRQASDMKGSNVWQVAEPGRITLVCRYAGTQQQVVLRLTPDVRTCTQSLAVGSFSCR